MATTHVAPLQFWIYYELKGSEQKNDFKLLQRMIELIEKDQESRWRKKGKNIDGEVER